MCSLCGKPPSQRFSIVPQLLSLVLHQLPCPFCKLVCWVKMLACSVLCVSNVLSVDLTDLTDLFGLSEPFELLHPLNSCQTTCLFLAPAGLVTWVSLPEIIIPVVTGMFAFWYITRSPVAVSCLLTFATLLVGEARVSPISAAFDGVECF